MLQNLSSAAVVIGALRVKHVLVVSYISLTQVIGKILLALLFEVY